MSAAADVTRARLHVIANDAVIARPAFIEDATSLLEAAGDGVVLHVRMKKANATEMYGIAARLQTAAQGTGSRIVVNERFDVALAAGACGVHLGARSLPVGAVRGAAPVLAIGYSAHAVGEAIEAAEAGADYLFLGTIWASATHPGECTAGLSLISGTSEATACPIYAIGGVTPSRAQEALLAGAYGVAVISGVWDAKEPAAAAAEYMNAMQAMS